MYALLLWDMFNISAGILSSSQVSSLDKQTYSLSQEPFFHSTHPPLLDDDSNASLVSYREDIFPFKAPFLLRKMQCQLIKQARKSHHIALRMGPVPYLETRISYHIFLFHGVFTTKSFSVVMSKSCNVNPPCRKRLSTTTLTLRPN